jgi:general secretion pathway protein J
MLNKKGFTLIEVLIAITITGIILGLVFTFFHIGFSSKDKMNKISQKQQEWNVFVVNFGSDLHNNFSSKIYSKNKFDGSYHKLSWLILNNDIIQQVTYSFNPQQNQIKREIINYKTEEVILEMKYFTDVYLNNVEFQFYNNNRNIWEKNWNYQIGDYLPGAVKLILNIKDIQIPSPVIINIYSQKKIN